MIKTKRICFLMIVVFIVMTAFTISVFAIGNNSIVNNGNYYLEGDSVIAWDSSTKYSAGIQSRSYYPSIGNYIISDVVFTAADIYCDDVWLKRLSDYQTDNVYAGVTETGLSAPSSGAWLEIETSHYCSKAGYGELRTDTYDYAYK